MNQLYCLAPTGNLLAHFRPDQMAVECEVTDESVDIMLHGMIGDSESGADSLTISKLLSDNKGKAVNLRVNSPGGLAYDGVAMFNAIQAHDGPTTGTIEGLAGSAATLAVIACDTVRCYQAGVFQPHYSMIMAMGHQADIRNALDAQVRLDLDLEKVYASSSGQSIETVKGQLLGPHGDGTRFSAEQALAAGYVDEVIKHTKKKGVAANLDAALPAMTNAMLRQKLAVSKIEIDKQRTHTVR